MPRLALTHVATGIQHLLTDKEQKTEQKVPAGVVTYQRDEKTIFLWPAISDTAVQSIKTYVDLLKEHKVYEAVIPIQEEQHYLWGKRAHWCLLHLTIDGGNVTQADFYDPKANCPRYPLDSLRREVNAANLTDVVQLTPHYRADQSFWNNTDCGLYIIKYAAQLVTQGWLDTGSIVIDNHFRQEIYDKAQLDFPQWQREQRRNTLIIRGILLGLLLGAGLATAAFTGGLSIMLLPVLFKSILGLCVEGVAVSAVAGIAGGGIAGLWHTASTKRHVINSNHAATVDDGDGWVVYDSGQ